MEYKQVAISVLYISILLGVFYFLKTFVDRYKYSHSSKIEQFEKNTSKYYYIFLILGMLVPLLEIPVYYYNIRPVPAFFQNVILSIASLLFFILSVYNSKFKQHIAEVFVVFFILVVLMQLNFYSQFPTDLMIILELFVLFFYAYEVFYKNVHYNIFILVFSLTLLLFYETNKITAQQLITDMYIICFVFAVNYCRYVIDKNTLFNMRIAYEAIRSENLFSVMVNNEGDVLTVSNRLKKLINITENEKQKLKIHEVLKTKNQNILNEKQFISTFQTQFKTVHIKWSLSKHENQNTLLIGTEITDLINFKNESDKGKKRLELVLENSSDLIIVLNKNKEIKNIYENADHANLFKEKSIGKHIVDLNLDENPVYQISTTIQQVYDKIQKQQAQFSITQNLFIEWYELCATPITNSLTKQIDEVVCTIRNITVQKNQELKKEIETQKIEIYNKILIELSTTPIEYYGSFEKAIQTITELVAQGLPCTRVGIWNYNNEHLNCIEQYDSIAKEHTNGLQLSISDYPIYFNEIKKGKIVKANKVLENDYLQELMQSYYIPLKIKSMIDVPIIAGGELLGILCCENQFEFKSWIDEDESFVKKIADTLSIFTEQHLRKNVEQKLHEYQNQLFQSNQKLIQITETIQDVFWLYNIKEERTEYINPSCIKILGKTPEDFYEKFDLWKEYVIPEDYYLLENAHKELLIKEFFEIEYRIVVNNELRWIYEKSFAIKNSNGEITHNSGICIDITRKKENKKTAIQRLG